jgi:predicted dehydrogenase
MAIEASGYDSTGGRIRLGMVGGGQGAFIGAVHRIAARIDGQFELIAGALSSEPARAKASALELGIAAERSYGSFEEMARAEAARPDGIEAVSIVTPNHVHAPAARAFLEAGIHVICDKPMTTTVAEAQGLVDLVEKSGKVFVLTHNYTGYPMVRQARVMIAQGELGDIRVVQSEYPQDWLTERAELSGSKQAEWRTDPKRSGAGGAIGDIGTHAYHLAAFVAGLETDALLAQLTTFAPGRLLDDDVQILLRYKGGARGMLWASQVAVGNENGLKLRIYGTKGGLEWTQDGSPVSASRSSYSPAPVPGRCRKPPASPACRVDTLRGISRALPRSMPKLRGQSAPRGPALHPMPERSIRPSMTAWRACASSKLR